MKKLIALALASAFAAPLVFADVTIGGSARSALDYVDYSGTSNKDSQFRIADQSSRIFFKIEDKLDNGASVLVHLESRFNIGVGSSDTTWGSRNTFIGYKSDLGLLAFGKRDNAYKLASADYLQALEAVFNDDASYYGKDQILRRLGDRQPQIIAYDSPSWGGFKVKASYNLDPDQTDGLDASTAAVTGSYSNDTFSIGGAYALADDQSKLGTKAANASNTGWQVGGTVKLGDGSISAVWERVNFDNGTTDADQDSYALAGTYKFGKFTVQGAYLVADELDNVADSGAQQFTLGGQYSLSKQSRVYLTYTKVDNDSNAKFKTEGPGLTLANGNDLSIVSLGVRTDF
ncbi:porin [Chitinolyticbacter meiyuanensis]|uniref:porin n=1 Tax=Chitinolyticbacter meiyuanensis TaxID=682798 RepID=UPI0011E5D3E0|nr:porin [Chitinolyticbacter meiyuanensis]